MTDLKLSVTIGTIVVCVGLIAVGFESRMKTSESLEVRVELLERKLDERARPAIYIQKASVYNTDGEIVIESHDEKGAKKE